MFTRWCLIIIIQMPGYEGTARSWRPQSAHYCQGCGQADEPEQGHHLPVEVQSRSITSADSTREDMRQHLLAPLATGPASTEFQETSVPPSSSAMSRSGLSDEEPPVYEE